MQLLGRLSGSVFKFGRLSLADSPLRQPHFIPQQMQLRPHAQLYQRQQEHMQWLEEPGTQRLQQQLLQQGADPHHLMQQAHPEAAHYELGQQYERGQQPYAHYEQRLEQRIRPPEAPAHTMFHQDQRQWHVLQQPKSLEVEIF